MGELIFTGICTLDGYLADADGRFDWGMPDEEVLADLNAAMREAGTYLYGRRMYELMTGWENDPAAAAQSEQSAEFAKIWQAAEKVVYSSTLDDVCTSRTQLRRRFEASDVAQLKRDSAAELYVAGPTLAAHALQFDLVDQVHLILCPVAVGGGLRVLPADLRLNLRLTAQHRYGNGMVALRYAVAH